jgi:hypothetical protein
LVQSISDLRKRKSGPQTEIFSKKCLEIDKTFNFGAFKAT